MTNGILFTTIFAFSFLVFTLKKCENSFPLGALCAARALKTGPRCRTIVNFCRIGLKQIQTKILATISILTSIYFPLAMTNEIISRGNRSEIL